MRQLSEESGLGDDETEETELDLEGKPKVCEDKFQNLLKRQKVYGDITQNASPEELENLLRHCENNVPDVSFRITHLFQIRFSQKESKSLPKFTS